MYKGKHYRCEKKFKDFERKYHSSSHDKDINLIGKYPFFVSVPHKNELRQKR